MIQRAFAQPAAFRATPPRAKQRHTESKEISGAGAHTLLRLPPQQNCHNQSWGGNTIIIHRRLRYSIIYVGLFIFPFRKDYNLLEDLEGLHAADRKENTTASEVKSGEARVREAQEEAQPTVWIPPGEAFKSPTYKHLFLKPSIIRFHASPLINHSSVY